MLKMVIYILRLTRTAMKKRLRSTLIITFKLVCFFSLMFYLSLTEDSKDQAPPYKLPPDVLCPVKGHPHPSDPSSSLSDGNIFFVETSNRMHSNFLFLCSVESASRVNPEAKITVLMKGLSVRNQTMLRNIGMSLLGCFPNVKVKPLHLEDLFADTPLKTWYVSALRKWEPYQLPILSDACRLALMYKFGGVYLDTDFIVLKSLKNLTNSIGIQSKYILNGAFFAFDRGHKFIEQSIQNFVAHYNAWIWGHQGPQLVTRMFKKWCSIRRLRDSQGCKGVSILPKEAFYPIRWQDWEKYFDVINATEIEQLFRNTYAIHVWNKKSKGTAMKIGSKTLLDQLFMHNCPSTYRTMELNL